MRYLTHSVVLTIQTINEWANIINIPIAKFCWVKGTLRGRLTTYVLTVIGNVLWEKALLEKQAFKSKPETVSSSFCFHPIPACKFKCTVFLLSSCFIAYLVFLDTQ